MRPFIVLGFLILLSYAEATEVNLEVLPRRGEVEIEVTDISYDELDIFSLKMPVEKSGGRELKLLCGFNPFYESHKSSLVLTHDSIYRGPRFSMDDQSCLKVFNFLKSHFEIVNSENPLVITIAFDSMEVKSIGRKEEGYGNKSPKLSYFE